MGRFIFYTILLVGLIAAGLYGYSFLLTAEPTPQIETLTIDVD